ncbi:MAG: multidrug effflux MFS transporter [Minicystis sp.]
MSNTRHDPVLLALILGVLTALGPLSIDMYLPSLPTIQRELGTTASLTQLTLAAYFAGLGIGQLAYGPLTDRFGRKRPLYAGLALYVVASIACALSPSVYMLVALRFLQAVGGAAGQVVTRAVVRDLYVGAAAAQLLSRLILVMGVAPILAPLVGGWVLLFAGWRAIFATLAVLGLGCLVLMITLLPETATARTPSLDVGHIGRNLRELSRDRSFMAYTLTGAFSQAGMFAYISGSPFVLIELFHVSPQRYGWIFGANAFGLIAGSQINHRLLARRSPGRSFRDRRWW